MSSKLDRAKHTVEAVERRLAAEAEVEIIDVEPVSAQTANESCEASLENPSIGSSAVLISICTIASRITGFIRTWAMAFALGSTMLSSSYQVANNLPNMLYEMVVGGMLVTAFLPVYISTKKRLGEKAGNDYASNLFSIVSVFLAFVTLLCIVFASQVVYTQSFWSDQSEMSDAVFFFQFFAIQILFYGASSILSGLLNANRDYLPSAIAPAINNLIVILSFLLYALIGPENPGLALFIIAIGNSLGVGAQVVIQWPALKRNGVRLRFHINFKDPALKETLAIGIPAIIVMISSFAVVSVQNAASYSFADNGPSIIYYARLWFTLPYAFLVVPITTTLFTEISDMQADDNIDGVKKSISSGTNQILFFMIPFMFYLIVFSSPLISLYHAGAFSEESIAETARYLAALALTLPLYGVNTYLQKVFSSLRILKTFAYINILTSVIQIILTGGAALLAMSGIIDLGIESIAYAGVAFFLIGDILLFVYLRKKYGQIGLRSTVKSCLNGCIFGLLGAVVGGGLLWVLEAFVAPIDGSILLAFVYVVICGLVSLFVTFGLALKFKVKETAFVKPLLARIGIGK